MTRREKRFLAFSVVMGGVLFVPQSAYAMHIMEGYLPPAYCAAWGALCLPFLAAGVVRLRRTVQAQRKALLLLAMSGAFIFVISSLKLPSVTGSCSHMTGTGLAAILFGPAYAAVLGLIVLVLSGGLPLLASDIVRADEVRAGLRDREERWVPHVSIWQVMRQGWAAVVGLMFNFFVIGLTFWPLAAGLGSGIVPKPLAYVLVVAVVWRVAARVREPQGGMLEAFYRVALPVAATLMLASPLLSGVFPGVDGMVLSILSYLGVATINVLGLVVLFWSAKSSEVGFSKMFAAFCASCAASLALGMLVFQLLGPEASRWFALVLLVAYLGAVLLGEVWRTAMRAHAAAPGSSGGESACGCEAVDVLEGGD